MVDTSGLFFGSREEIVTNESGGKKGKKLARMDLLPYDTLFAISEHYGKGAEKYTDRNWELGYDWSLSMAALQRHLAAWWQGEDIDAETGSSHLMAVAFHALALATFERRGVGVDDRPTKTDEAETAAFLERIRSERSRSASPRVMVDWKRWPQLDPDESKGAEQA